MTWIDENKQLLIAFAIAPIVPIGIISLLSIPIGFLIFIIGAPIAYFCAAVIGIPLFYIYKKYGITAWSYFALGGALCAVPGVLIFIKRDVPIVYSLQSISTFTLLGIIGGYVFWRIYQRRLDTDAKQSNFLGVIALMLLCISLAYTYFLGKYRFIDGKTLSIDYPFVSSEDTKVTIEVEGKKVSARLPKGVPYRKNCEIGVVVWRELFTHEKTYSLSHYPDYPQAHHYQWLNEDAKRGIGKSCA